jgi:hypothetical protein
MRLGLLLAFPLLAWADLSYQVECRLGSETNDPSLTCSYDYFEQGKKTLRKFAQQSVYEDRSTKESFTLHHSRKTIERGQSSIGFVWEKSPAFQIDTIQARRQVDGVELSGRRLLRRAGMSLVREEVWSDSDGIVIERLIHIQAEAGDTDASLYPETKIFLQTKKISRDPIPPKEFAIPEGYAEETARN